MLAALGNDGGVRWRVPELNDIALPLALWPNGRLFAVSGDTLYALKP